MSTYEPKESKYGTGHTSQRRISTSPQAINASAPSSQYLKEFKSEKLDFVKPTYNSFDDLCSDQESDHEKWLKAPRAEKDFFSLCEEEKFLTENEEWIYQPNAETQEELLVAANNTNNVAPFTNTGTIGTRVQNGQVLFVTRKK